MPSQDPNWSPIVAVYGDLGLENGRSFPYLQAEAQLHVINAVLHAGDIAYNLDSDDGNVGDVFMRKLQAIAAYVPYMVAPGNHEQA